MTFDKNVLQRYQREYPDLDIYCWVNWKQAEWHELRVEHVQGVWRTLDPQISSWIETGGAPQHEYKFRKNDTPGNAKDSYELDLYRMEKTRPTGSAAA